MTSDVKESRVIYKLVAVVSEEDVRGREYRDLVPEGERYTPEEERQIKEDPYFYKTEAHLYDEGPVIGRQVGQIFGEDEWFPNSPEEDEVGIYKMLFEKQQNP